MAVELARGGGGGDYDRLHDNLVDCFGKDFMERRQDYPPHSFRDLYDVYRGSCRHITGIVMLSVFQRMHWINRTVLNIQIVPGVGPIHEEHFEMQEAAMTHQVTQTTPRLATAIKQKIVGEKRRYALGIKIIHDYLLTHEAPAYIDAQYRQLICAVWHTIAERAMVALLQVPQTIEKDAPDLEGAGPRNYLGDSMREKNMFAIINKQPNSVRFICEESRRLLKERPKMSNRADMPGTMIFPAGSFTVCRERPEYQYHFLNGVGPWSPQEAVPKGKSVTVVESIKFSTNQLYDPCYRIVTIGGYFTMGAMHVRNVPMGHLTPEHMSTMIYSESIDNHHTLTLTDMLCNSGLFTVDDGGEMDDGIDDEEDGDDDSDENGVNTVELMRRLDGLTPTGEQFFKTFRRPDPRSDAVAPTWGQYFDCHRVHGDGTLGSGIRKMLQMYACPPATPKRNQRVESLLRAIRARDGGRGGPPPRPGDGGGGFAQRSPVGEESIELQDMMAGEDGEQREEKYALPRDREPLDPAGGEQAPPGEEALFARAVGELVGMLEGLVINRSAWVIGVLYQHGIWCGLSFVGLRPNKRYYMGSALYACNNGVAGRTLVGDLDTLIGNDASRKIHQVHMSMTAGTIIHKPQAVVRLDNVLCKKYYGGNGHLIWNGGSQAHMQEWRNRGGDSARRSIFVVPQPFAVKPPASYYLNAAKFSHFPWKKHLDYIWGQEPTTLFDPKEHTPGVNIREFTPGEIYALTRHLYQEMQFVSDETKEPKLSRQIRNRGHWGTAVYPGCGAGRVGQGILQTENELNKVTVPN